MVLNPLIINISFNSQEFSCILIYPLLLFVWWNSKKVVKAERFFNVSTRFPSVNERSFATHHGHDSFLVRSRFKRNMFRSFPPSKKKKKKISPWNKKISHSSPFIRSLFHQSFQSKDLQINKATNFRPRVPNHDLKFGETFSDHMLEVSFLILGTAEK